VVVVNKKLQTLDLFAGIGGFAYGLEKTGLYETKYFCEWDSVAQRVLKKQWPDVPCFGDIKDLSGSDVGNVDIITGGFPCQDISLAGEGVGIEGDRSSHWYHYLRLINEIKPKGCIIENVSALRSRGLDTVLRGLDEVGYDAEWHCITAKHLGAYHERDRVFVLAYSRSIGVSGFKPLVDLEEVGQGWESRKANLQQVYDNPFGRSNCFPQPLLRGSDVRPTGWVDRLKQVGNSVYWPIVERLGYHMYENVKDYD
jgi:DNA-cytosine methyltransferase